MNDKHSEQWEILRRQGRKHKKEKAVLILIIVVLFLINCVLCHIVWGSRHNNETASAAAPDILTEAATATAPATTIFFRYNKRYKKDRVNGVWVT